MWSFTQTRCSSPLPIKKAENVKVIKETIGVSCTGMTDPWMPNLTSTIAEHYCCRSFRRSFKGKKTKHIGLVGLEDDFAICKSVVLYAIDCIQATKKEIAAENKGLPQTYIRKMCNAYGWGFIYGLQQAFKDQDQEHQEWGLVLVVPQQVTDVMIGMGKPSSFGHADFSSDWQKHYGSRGYEDGQKFDPKSRLERSRPAAAIMG